MKYQHCILLPFALALLIVGLITLLLWGIGNLEPYNHTKYFTTATCTVVSSNYTGLALCNATSERTNDSLKDPDVVSVGNRYPCLLIYVNYTEQPAPVYPGTAPDGDPDYRNNGNSSAEDGGYVTVAKEANLVSNAYVVLYDMYESWAAQRKGDTNKTCSLHVCEADSDDREEDVEDFREKYGGLGDTFPCFYNPSNHVEVYAHVVTGNSILHALVWPALAMGFGLFLLIVFIFQSCEVWVCRNPKLQERRSNKGQTYNNLAVAYYRNPNHVDIRDYSSRDSPVPGTSRHASGTKAPSKSRLPKLSAAADIVRKLSLRGRSSSNTIEETSMNRTVDSAKTYAGEPSNRWSVSKGRHVSTT